MKNLPRNLLISLLFVGVLSAPAFAQETLDGEWTGGVELDGKWIVVNVRLSPAAEAAKSALDMPYRREMGLKITQVRFAPPAVSFQVARDQDTLLFEGTHNDGTMLGEVRQGQNRGSFQLARIVKVDPALLDEYAGIYSVGRNKLISIMRVDSREGIQRLNYLDFETGRLGRTYPLSQVKFFSGPGLLTMLPVEVKMTFIRNAEGKVSGLKWQETGSAEVHAARVSLYRQENVSFANGEVTLAGTLVLPNGPGPHPAVVIAHGFGPEHRNVYRHYVNLFVSRGIAVLTYDKRGVGGSTGKWLRANFDDLAGDTLAGFKLLKTRKEIDPGRIGLWGPSEGGWTVPLAASRAKDVAFIVLVPPAGVTPLQQEFYRVEFQLRADGASEQEVREALDFLKQQFEVARTGEGMEQLSAAIEKSEKKPWFAYVNPGYSLEVLKSAWENELNHDPVPVLEKVSCPVLAILGERDTFFPVKEGVARVEAALKKGGNKDFAIKVFPKANHGLWEAETGGNRDYAKVKRYAPGFLQTMVDWMVKRVHAADHVGRSATAHKQ
jgi:uncharacterized protein